MFLKLWIPIDGGRTPGHRASDPVRQWQVGLAVVRVAGEAVAHCAEFPDAIVDSDARDVEEPRDVR